LEEIRKMAEDETSHNNPLETRVDKAQNSKKHFGLSPHLFFHFPLKIKLALASACLTGIIGLSVPFFHLPSVGQPPQIAIDYDKSQASLSHLRIERGELANKINIPYETPEIRRNLDQLYQEERENLALLDKTILSIEKDAEKMRKNPEFINYHEKIDKANKRVTYQMLGGFGGCLLSCLTAMGFACYDDKKRIEESKLKGE